AAPARRRAPGRRLAHRGVHRRAAAGQRPLQGQGDGAADGARRTVTIRLYDTARQEVVPFEPGPIVTMYTCGITPYAASHLGHAATYITYDVIQRRLRDLGHQTHCVRNITDVDDDILRKARELDVNFMDLAADETARFEADMGALGLLPAFSEPRATS